VEVGILKSWFVIDRSLGDKNMNSASVWCLLLITLYPGTAALAQNTSAPKNPSITIRATHLLGFEGARDNVNGTLSIEGDVLQFRKDGNPAVELRIDAIEDVFLGEESREIGGVPMTLGKAAIPYSGEPGPISSLGVARAGSIVPRRQAR
jgi:hypothetical protein